MSVDEKKLREKLEMILDFMAQEKLISKEACEKMKEDKEGFLDKMVTDLSNSGMEDKDIRDEHFQKKLMGTLVSHSLGMKEAVKMGMTALTDAIKEKNPDDPQKEPKPFEQTLGNPKANKELDKIQVLHVLVSNKLNSENLHKLPAPSPAAKAKADETLEKKLGGDEKEKKQMQELVNELEKQRKEARQNAYGGDDPTITGEVQATISVIITDIADWYEPPADPNALSERVKEATEELPGDDPLGIKDKHKKSTMDQVADILSPIVECVSCELDHQDKLTPKLNHHH